MLKKMLLLAVTALAVLAVPASASANMFLMEGQPIGANETAVYHGPASFTANSGAGGVECEEITATVATSTNDASVTAFSASECETFGALNEVFNCHVTGNTATPTTLPWTVDINTNGGTNPDLTITGVHIDNGFEPGCIIPGAGEVPGITLLGNVTASPTPTGSHSVKTLDLSGEIATSLGAAQVSGELTSTAGNTYEIE